MKPEKWYDCIRSGMHDPINNQHVDINKGFIATICHDCGRVIYIPVNYTHIVSDETYDNMVFGSLSFKGKCESCDTESIVHIGSELDPNIAEVINLLNLIGYETVFCCEGHINQDNSVSHPYIMFSDSEIANKHGDKIPVNWYWEYNKDDENYEGDYPSGVTLRYAYDTDQMNRSDIEWKCRAIADLSVWARHVYISDYNEYDADAKARANNLIDTKVDWFWFESADIFIKDFKFNARNFVYCLRYGILKMVSKYMNITKSDAWELISNKYVDIEYDDRILCDQSYINEYDKYCKFALAKIIIKNSDLNMLWCPIYIGLIDSPERFIEDGGMLRYIFITNGQFNTTDYLNDAINWGKNIGAQILKLEGFDPTDISEEEE